MQRLIGNYASITPLYKGKMKLRIYPDGSTKNFPLRWMLVLFLHVCILKAACVHLRDPKSISASTIPNLALWSHVITKPSV